MGISKNTLLRTALAGLLMWSTVPTAHALPDDRNQPIRITADSAIRDERQGETRYTGSVELTQGSLQINADTLTLRQGDGETQIITATGSPASLRQIPEADSPPIEATAGKIEYNQNADTVTLTQDARIEQDGAIVTGAVIDYVLGERRVTASGTTETKDDKQRVEMIIPPSAIERPDKSEN